MKSKTHFAIFLALSALFSFGFQCGKDKIIYTIEHAFKIPVDISPLKKTYLLGDTIWMETDIAGKMLYDTLTNQNVLLDSAGLGMYIQFIELSAVNTNPPDGFCQVIGSAFGNSYRQYSKGLVTASLNDTICGNTSLKIRIGIKPNYRGNYLLALSAFPNIQKCNESANTSYKYSTYTYQFKPADLNKDVFDALPDSVKRNDNFPSGNLSAGLTTKNAFTVKVQ